MNVAEDQRPPAGELYLDHLGHFVPDLGAAAAVWEKLGFAVTPVSHHHVSGKPAGTSNRCVMLEEGYLELLAPSKENAADTPHAQRVRDRMKRFVGVHLACFGTPDAAAEHARLAAHGFEPEPPVSLERTVQSGARLRFNVIYVPPARMPEGRVQYVEHLTPEHVWQKEYVNADVRLSALYVVAEDPAQAAARWGRFAGLLPRPAREGNEGDLVELRCARGRVVIGTGRGMSRLLGKVPSAPALAGYALSCGDPDGFAGRCEKQGLQVRKTGSGCAVELPPALGGCWRIEAHEGDT